MKSLLKTVSTAALLAGFAAPAYAVDFLNCDSLKTAGHSQFELEEVTFAISEIEGDENVYLNILPIFKIDSDGDGKLEQSTEKFTHYLPAKEAQKVLAGKKKLKFDVQGVDLNTNGYAIEVDLSKLDTTPGKNLPFIGGFFPHSRKPTVTISRYITDSEGRLVKDMPLRETLSCEKKNFFGHAKCEINEKSYAFDTFVLAAYEEDTKGDSDVQVKGYVMNRNSQVVSIFAGQTDKKSLKSFGDGNSESISAQRDFAVADLIRSEGESAEQKPFAIPESVEVKFGEKRKELKEGDPDVRDVTIQWGSEAGQSTSATCAIQPEGK